MFCQHCGQNIGNAKECPSCGYVNTQEKKGFFKKITSGDFLGENLFREDKIISNKNVIYSRKDIHITIDMKDKEKTADLINQILSKLGTTINQNAELDENIINDLASQLGLSVTEIKELIKFQGTQCKMTAPELKGPLKEVICPKCKHKGTNRQNWCIYCGHEFAKEEKIKQDEVDKKILSEDVKLDKHAKEEQKQQIKDSYKKRLEEL